MEPTHDAGACELMRKARTAAGVLLVALVALVALPAVAAAAPEGEAHAGGASTLFWPTANFLILVATLYYFLKTPLTTYLRDRSASIRKDLVEAAELKASATAQLATIDQKVRALPGELEVLRARGAAEIVAEEQRIAAAAAADRDRLLDQTRKEIDLQVRLAKRAILEHAAELSVQLATERITKDIAPADHVRLVDRYLEQVKSA